jgi:cytochrome c556
VTARDLVVDARSILGPLPLRTRLLLHWRPEKAEGAGRNIPVRFPVRSPVARAAVGIDNHKRCFMRSKVITGGFVLAVGIGCAAGAVAQVKPETLVDQRVSAMRLQGKYFYGSLLPMAQGKIPYDANIATRNAGYLEVLAKMPWDGYDPSTKDLKTRALPDVYSEPAKFKAAQDSLNAEMVKLVAATKSGNEASVKAAIMDVNKACGSCHDTFRAKAQ